MQCSGVRYDQRIVCDLCNYDPIKNPFPMSDTTEKGSL